MASPAVPEVTDRIEPCCAACDDSGWWPHYCDGVHAMCGRKRRHLPHSYSIPCPCRSMNTVYQERLATQGRGR